jgi:glycosyltransferase involved in cell wall biosynthesis
VDWPRQCAVVVPCFNEAARIGGLVRVVRDHLPRIMVVDDGSNDSTAAQAMAAGAEVFRHPRNLGKGAALRTGLTQARQLGFGWALLMDGDGQHRPEDIPVFLRKATETGVALVIGNRMHQAQAIPWLRRAVNRWMSRRISTRAGRSLPDSQCGFRLLNLGAWARLRLETDRFEVESEMLLAFIRAGHRVEFVPISVVGAGPCSRIHPLRDTWRWLRWWRRDRRGSA